MGKGRENWTRMRDRKLKNVEVSACVRVCMHDSIMTSKKRWRDNMPNNLLQSSNHVQGGSCPRNIVQVFVYSRRMISPCSPGIQRHHTFSDVLVKETPLKKQHIQNYRRFKLQRLRLVLAYMHMYTVHTHTCTHTHPYACT